MQEWRAHYPDLKEVYKEEATIDDDVFFRDYSVHDYIEGELKKRRLMPSDIDINKTYYSSEFFKNATSDDIKNAIKDIKENYRNNTNKYKYYTSYYIKNFYSTSPPFFHFLCVKLIQCNKILKAVFHSKFKHETPPSIFSNKYLKALLNL